MTLTPEQRRFIEFHAEGRPFRWAWLDRFGHNPTLGPETWVKFRVWKRGSAPGWVRHVTISADGLRGLDHLFEFDRAAGCYMPTAEGPAAVGLPPP